MAKPAISKTGQMKMFMFKGGFCIGYLSGVGKVLYYGNMLTAVESPSHCIWMVPGTTDD